MRSSYTLVSPIIFIIINDNAPELFHIELPLLAHRGHIKWMHDRIGWHQEGGVWAFAHVNGWCLQGALDYVDEAAA